MSDQDRDGTGDVATAGRTGDEPAEGEPHDVGHTTPYATDRSTAPQSPYTSRDVAVGAAIAAGCLAFTVILPFVLA